MPFIHPCPHTHESGIARTLSAGVAKNMFRHNGRESERERESVRSNKTSSRTQLSEASLTKVRHKCHNKNVMDQPYVGAAALVIIFVVLGGFDHDSQGLFHVAC